MEATSGRPCGQLKHSRAEQRLASSESESEWNSQRTYRALGAGLVVYTKVVLRTIKADDGRGRGGGHRPSNDDSDAVVSHLDEWVQWQKAAS